LFEARPHRRSPEKTVAQRSARKIARSESRKSQSHVPILTRRLPSSAAARKPGNSPRYQLAGVVETRNLTRQAVPSVSTAGVVQSRYRPAGASPIVSRSHLVHE